MASYSDDFNRATLGSNWAAVNGGTWDINASVRARLALMQVEVGASEG